MAARLLLCVLAFAVTDVPAVTVERLREQARAYAASDRFFGAVAVARDGQILYAEAFGNADEEWGIPNTTDTKFRIGSVTKQPQIFIDMKIPRAAGALCSTVLDLVKWDAGREAKPPECPKEIQVSSSENEFFLKVVDARLRFERDDSGKVTSLVLVQGGREARGTRQP